jgi:hypothetical protein
VTSAGEVRRDSRDPTVYAVHSKMLIDLASDMGVKVTDENGEYIGLTYEAIAAMMRELHDFRSGDAWVSVTNSFGARSEELLVARVQLDRLHKWLRENTILELKDGQDPVGPTIRLLDDTKTLVKSLWPHLQTMWGNVVHVMRSAGVKIG